MAFPWDNPSRPGLSTFKPALASPAPLPARSAYSPEGRFYTSKSATVVIREINSLLSEHHLETFEC